MLRDLYAALENDALLIAETLARETLAGIRSGAEMTVLEGRYSETTYLRLSEGEEPSNHDFRKSAVELEAENWKEWETKLAERFGTTTEEIPLLRLSGLLEDADRFFVVALLSRAEGEATVATVVWPKRSFDMWWAEEAALLTMDVDAAPWRYTLAEPSGSGCEADTWRERYYMPAPRSSHTAVWTGTEMIIWGGYDGDYV